MSNLKKVKCTECNAEFGTKEELQEHKAGHNGVQCDTCPIDMAIRGLSRIFRRNKNA